MVRYFKTKEGGRTAELVACETDCWVVLENPSAEEIAAAALATGIPAEFMECALDEEESARIDSEDGAFLTLVDVPAADTGGKMATFPMAAIYNARYFVTVCTRPTPAVSDFLDGRIKKWDTVKRKELLYRLLYAVFTRFLSDLKRIDRAGAAIQMNMNSRAMQNKELMEMLDLQKTLVFFSASLAANRSVMQKLLLGAAHAAPADREILEEAFIENKQAMEMCGIYREILKNTMDAFSSVINNNLNFIMKFLTVITIILSIPMVIAGFWGMNTGVPWEGQMYGFYLAVGLSVVSSIVVVIFLWRRRMM